MRAKWLSEIEASEAKTRKWNKNSSWLTLLQLAILAFVATNLYAGKGNHYLSVLVAVGVAAVGAVIRPKLERMNFEAKWRKHFEILRAQSEKIYELRVSGRSGFPIKDRFS